jgi:glucosamine kinase
VDLESASTGVDLVVGVDAGGTRTRAVVTTLDGQVCGRSTSGPGNPVAHGVPAAVRAIGAAVAGALDPATGPPGRRVGRVLVAAAGGGASFETEVRRDLAERLSAGGPAPVVDCVSDLTAAFAAGTAEADGYLLVAGTGAASAEFAGGRISRTVDGNGWLLGDDGGGFWLGRQAVRAVLAALEGHGAPTSMIDPVAAALGVPPRREPVLSAVYNDVPVRLARLAPVVSAAHRHGDPVATGILRAAGTALLETVSALAPVAGRPLVLAGGVLDGGGEVARIVREGAAARWSVRPAVSADPAAGAAWLALRAEVGAEVAAMFRRDELLTA